MSLPVQNLRVRTLTVGEREVSWEVKATSMDTWDYEVRIAFSESPEGPFTPLTQWFIDRYLFVDRRAPLDHKTRKIWYQLEVRNRQTLESVFVGPATNEADAPLDAQSIRRQEQTMFTQVTGRLCWLFKRRTFGTRCSACFDSMSGKRTRSSCRDCYDTGFLRGYLAPIEVWVQVDPETPGLRNQSEQIDEVVMTTARLSFYPNVTINDVLVEAENKRWRIQSVSKSERLRATIKQELTMRQIQESDIEYTLPLNIEEALKDIQASPARMFTNPTQLEAAISERTPNVFANYPTYPSILED